MNPLFLYFFKVNIALILFYVLFRLLFSKDTFWIARRIYLVSIIFISALYPLVVLSGWLESKEPIPVFVAEWTTLLDFTVVQQESSTYFTVKNILLSLYVMISLLFFVRLLVQFFSILRWRKRSEKSIVLNTLVRVVNEDITPFSFFKDIYINPNLYSNKNELQEILIHEKTHAKQWHSLDVLLGELLTIICWINPISWLLKHEIRQNLEFLADNCVAKSGCDLKIYQYHLLDMALYSPEIQIVNKFNVSPLKKRIIMMNQVKTKKAELLKYLLILPLLSVLILSSNAESLLSFNYAAMEEEQIQTQVKSEAVEAEDVVFEIVEKAPKFPGGNDELFKYLARTIKYPTEAHQKGEQGRVVVQFVVTELGKIRDAKVARSVSPSLDREAIRIVESMPDWIPGEQRGQKVNVKYTLPINFTFDPKNIKEEEADDIIVVGEKKM